MTPPRPLLWLLLTMLAAGALSSTATAGQATDSTPEAARHIKVGVIVDPPFVVHTSDGFAGMAIDLWERIARDQSWTWSYEAFDLADALTQLEAGTIEIAVGAIAQTPERERRIDFSPVFVDTGLAIASRPEPIHTVYDVIFHLGDRAFLQLALALAAICVVFGLVMWWAERRSNRDHFGGRVIHGAGSGIWWSMVTMSTVGYGDKTPRTSVGRFLAIIWIFLSVVLLAAFTGTIASSMTMGRMAGGINSIQSLRSVPVGVMRGTDGEAWLRSNLIQAHAYDSIETGLDALARDRIGAFVGDRPTIEWVIQRRATPGEFSVSGNLQSERMAFAVPQGSPDREIISIEMLKILVSDDWHQIQFQYGVGGGRTGMQMDADEWWSSRGS